MINLNFGEKKMNTEDKNSFLDEFKKVDGSAKLEMWYYALEQEVIWDKILVEMSKIAKEQGIDKKLDKLVQDEMNNASDDS